MFLDDNIQQALRQMNKIATNEVLKKEDIHQKLPGFYYSFILDTPPIAEILCVINPRAIVVCGFLMKSL